MTEKYIVCEFKEGMFSNEYAVKIRLGEKTLSLFVPKSSVKEKGEGKGLLLVKVVDKKNHVVALPAPILETGWQYMEVPQAELKTA